MVIRYLILFLSLLLLGVLSCSKKIVIVETDAPNIGEEIEKEIEEEEIVEAVEEEEAVYVLCEIQRSACYGDCPSYSVKLYSDGRAIYHGKTHVEKIGYYEALCSAQGIESIFFAAEEASFFALRSQYPTDGRVLSDLPRTITYIKRGGLDKRILDHFDAPANLIQFEKWIDNFFDDLDWVKVN